MNTHHQRVGLALELLSSEILPFFERSLREVYGDRWEETARASIRSQSVAQPGPFHWDAQAILTVMWDLWNTVFRKSLGLVERSLVSELREFRNRWAHRTTFTEDDGYRVLDSAQRLLIACQAPKAAQQIEEHKLDLLRDKLGRRVNEELAQARFNRSRIVDVTLYALCASAIAAMMILMWGSRHPLSAGFVVGFTVFVFMYLIYRRLQASPPAYGVHECGRCGKVIYSENCPYCDPAPRPQVAVHRSHIHNSRPNLIEIGRQQTLTLLKRWSVTCKKA